GGRLVTLGRQAAFWIGALVALLLFLWVFSGILLPFIMGMALAYLLDPIADRLQRLGLSRFWATIAIVLAPVLALVIFALVVIPLLVSQLAGFLDRLPSYVQRLQALGDWLVRTKIGRYFGSHGIGANVNQMVAQGASWIAGLLASIWAGGQALINL